MHRHAKRNARNEGLSDARLTAMAAALGICFTNCAGAAMSMVVKPPLQSQCQRLPIRGCGEIVDGVLLYVQGDKPGALEKIQAAKDQNVPAQLKPFAKALRDTASLPGAEDYATPLNEIADLLDSAGAKPPAVTIVATGSLKAKPDEDGKEECTAIVTTKPAEVSRPHDQHDPATRALSATADFARLTTETVDLAATDVRTPCKVSRLDALCVKAREGAIVITDVIAGRACPDRLFIGATLSDSPDFGFRWQFEAGSIPLTGARLSVGAEDWLQVAIVPGKKGPSNSAECFVTWSGFRPWIVPENVY